MSNMMSTTSSVLRKTLVTAPRVPFVGSRMVIQACSGPANISFYSTEAPKATKTPYQRKTKRDGVTLGYIIDTSAAPTVDQLMTARLSKIAHKGMKASGVKRWNYKRALFNIPLSNLDNCVAWSEAVQKTEKSFEIDFSDPASLTSKTKPPQGPYSEQERLLLSTRSPTLAALGNSLYKELKPVIPAGEERLLKAVSTPSGWGIQFTLMAHPTGSLESALVPVALEKLQKEYATKLGKEKVRITGTWIEKSKDGEKEMLKFPFKA